MTTKFRRPASFTLIPLLLLLGTAAISRRDVSATEPKESTPQQNPQPERPAVVGAIPASVGDLPREVDNLSSELNKAQEEGRWDDAEKLLNALLSRVPELKDNFRDVTASIHLNRSLEEKKWDAAEKHLDELIQIEPQAQTELLPVRIQILAARGDTKQAGALARQALANEKDRCRLNAIAQALLDHAGGPHREIIVLVHELALAANKGDLMGDCRAGHLSVLAHAEFLLGRKSKAVEIADKALHLADDPEMKKRIQVSLYGYKSGSVPKTD